MWHDNTYRINILSVFDMIGNTCHIILGVTGHGTRLSVYGMIGHAYNIIILGMVHDCCLGHDR